MVYNLELSTIICFIKENEYALIMNIKKTQDCEKTLKRLLNIGVTARQVGPPLSGVISLHC